MALPVLYQSPRAPAFVQDPYPFYARARAAGPLVYWSDLDMPMATDHATVSALLRDKRFGRAVPATRRKVTPPHLEPFQALEDHSMLELEPPDHTRLRRLVLRAFTSRRIAAMHPEITALAHGLIDRFPREPFDLLAEFAEPLPVRVIARMMGVPDSMTPQLLNWSHAMVAMYQSRRDTEIEVEAGAAAQAFTAYLKDLIKARRRAPGEDLLSHLITARDRDDKLSDAEMIATAILLLNAGHEATVHSIANGVKALLEHGFSPRPDAISALTEEVLRFDPPLHLFTRFATEDVCIAGHRFSRDDEVGLLLASAGRDPAVFDQPEVFDPGRSKPAHQSFGGGIHFCVGAPLARLELDVALSTLFSRCPDLYITEPPTYADRYHFHGLTRLMVATSAKSVPPLP
ncbi:MAG: cytochrome P450 [Pseudomonadota bacterium]